MSPTLSWLFVAVVVGGPTLLLWSLIRIAGHASRQEEALLESELRLGIALARAEQIRREHAFWNAPENQKIEIDLDDCRDASEVRSRLAGSLKRFGYDEPTHTVE
jgi:hypothetical protein